MPYPLGSGPTGFQYAKDLKALRRGPPLIAAIGSSTVARGEANVVGGYQRTWGGVMNVANILNAGVFYHPQAMSFAVTGQGTQHMLDVQLPQVLLLDPKPKGCYIQPMANDIRSGVAFATSRQNVEAIVKALDDAGIVPIIGVPQPTLGDTATIQAGFAQAARYLRDLAAATPRAILVDPTPKFLDPSLSTYESLAAVTDTTAPRIHLNHLGTYDYGAEIGAALVRAGWPSNYSPALRSNGDLFGANNRTGSLTANGMMSGSGGATGGATGTLGAGWQFTSNSVGGTVALSQQADGTGCVVTVGGTATAGTGLVLYRDLSGSELAAILAGDTTDLTVEAAWGQLTNVAYVCAQMRWTQSGVQTDDIDGTPVSQSGPLRPTSQAIFRTVPRLMTASPSAGRIRLSIFPEASAAWSGAITFKSAAPRKRF